MAFRPGAIIFSSDKNRLAGFYEATVGMKVEFADENVTVLASAGSELVIHLLPNEPAVSKPPRERLDCYIKPFFPVASLDDVRAKAAAHGGKLRPKNEEWEARGFRACEAIDPDGNVIQFREKADLGENSKKD